MAIPAILSIMGAISGISSIGSAISNSKAHQEALDLQKDQFDWLKSLTEEQKALFMRELEGYESVFGSLEKNLANYYENLSADNVIKAKTAELSKSFSAARQELSAELARRGLSSSGAAVAGYNDLAYRQIQEQANIRDRANADVMQAKLGWYDRGQRVKSQALNGLQRAYSQGANTATYLADHYGRQASQFSSNAASAGSSLGSTIGSIVNAGLLYGEQSKGLPNATAAGSTLKPSGSWSYDPYAVPGDGIMYKSKKPWYAPK